MTKAYLVRKAGFSEEGELLGGIFEGEQFSLYSEDATKDPVVSYNKLAFRYCLPGSNKIITYYWSHEMYIDRALAEADFSDSLADLYKRVSAELYQEAQEKYNEAMNELEAIKCYLKEAARVHTPELKLANLSDQHRDRLKKLGEIIKNKYLDSQYD